MPLVSVVIPTYNRLNLLKDTLESVFSQSFSDFEVLVIDDGSTESFDSLNQQYGDQVTFIRLPHSGLPSIGRNYGIKKATGQYIAFLDSDDLWVKDKLKIQVQLFSDNPKIALTSSDAYVLKPGSPTLEDSYLKYHFRGTGFLLDDLIDNNFIITSTCMVRSDALKKTGGFSEDPAFRAIEDYELWLRIARNYQIQYLPESLVIYRDAEISLRSEISLINYHDGLDKIFTSLQKNLPFTEDYKSTHVRLSKKIYENKVAILCLFLEIGDKVHFRSMFKDLVVVHPLSAAKMCVRLIRTYIRQIKTDPAKKSKLLE